MIEVVCAALLLFAPSESPEQSPVEVEAQSLLGEPLARPNLPEDFRLEQTEKLAGARAELERNPHDADALVWVGRRLGYLGRYGEAVDAFSLGVERFPEDARFFRHRGHRYITLRQFDDAIADLSRAAAMTEGEPDAIEPDGLPNARNIPTSTLQSNIWYHLGLAHYLTGNFETALEAYRSGMEVSNNPDGIVSMSHWLYMTLRRLGRDEEAAEVLTPITAEMDVIENGSYHRLLLFYRGELSEQELLGEGSSALDDVTTGYGVANWHLYNGDSDRAYRMFRAIVDRGEWAAFGSIAAEAELSRR